MTNKAAKNKDEAHAFETLALADRHIIKKSTKVSVPSEDAVIEAKKWVDFNEK